jgi:hypothetical protein
MSAITCANHKTFGDAFLNEVCYTKLTYDFSTEGGATTNTFKLGTTQGKIMIINATVQVETACTSTDAAVVTIGISGGDVDAFCAAATGAVANLVDDFTAKETAGQKIVVADGGVITLYIADYDLTAGKINLFLEWMKVA